MTGPGLDGLSGRIRAALLGRDVREVRMFGAHCFMVDGAIAVAADRDGGLLVHVDRAADAAHLRRPHADRAEMGAGRSMGAGWIRVAPQGVARDEDLLDWIATALTDAPQGRGDRS